MRALLVEDNLECAQAITAAVPEWEWAHARTGMDALLTLLSPLALFDAVLLDMDLPAFAEVGWLEPLRWEQRLFYFQGEVVLRLLNKLAVRPQIVMAISGVPGNNDRLVAVGGITHNANGKDPRVIRGILMGAGVESYA